MPHVRLDAARRSVRFDRPGIEVNFGAIGKGYALDRMGALLRRRGARRALLSAGHSSVLALGGNHLTNDIALHIRSLRGRFVAQGTRQAPYLDDPSSYSVTVDHGEVAVDLASLNALMTRALDDHSNVRGLPISIDGEGNLRQKGTVRKGIPVPFDVKANVSPTPDGRIRIHSESVKGFGLPVNPLLKAFSVKMDDLFKVDPGRGVVVDGNDILLDPSSLLPPPAMRGAAIPNHLMR